MRLDKDEKTKHKIVFLEICKTNILNNHQDIQILTIELSAQITAFVIKWWSCIQSVNDRRIV
ncbi:hypothetical protein BpHYR1_026702 [Brachionus plicatilis]|uniref:Uncharacterized protein n=1 Tax=Brachionus plicatilis TaxID=10195 RepID=A0A3M7Q5J6_BRAPC|nr:hypothetical protein BpHYR1_026702 [Brachionus plicatilis]